MPDSLSQDNSDLPELLPGSGKPQPASPNTAAYALLIGLIAWVACRYLVGDMFRANRLGDVGIVCTICFITAGLALRELKPSKDSSAIFLTQISLTGTLLGAAIYEALQHFLPTIDPLGEYCLRLVPLALLVVFLLVLRRAKHRTHRNSL